MADERRNLIGPYIPEGSFFRETIQQVKLVYNLILDNRVPLATKLIPVLSLAYLISPVDFLPDVIPVITQLDDLAVVMLGLRFFLELAPPEVVREHLKRITQSSHWTVTDQPPAERPKTEGDVVDGQYRPEE